MNNKTTLNLPNTSFSMRANLAKSELITLKKWQKDNLYQIIRNSRKGKKIFILHDGPPYANGPIHIGHAINKILKDIINKSKCISGFDIQYIPGWDCHGLPIEHKIEKIIGSKKKCTKSKFRNLCRKYANKQIQSQKKDFIRIGIIGNWDNNYSTMNFSIEANTLRVLSQVISKGYIYEKQKPVYWCINCKSSLAEAEVEYKNKKSNSIILMFEAIDQKKILTIFNARQTKNTRSITIASWTTNPWTLTANKAICVHPKEQYILIEFKNRLLIISKNTSQSVMKRCNIQNWTIKGICNGIMLKNIKFKHPILNKLTTLITSEQICANTGTGIVHIAPSHGPEDYIISKEHKIKSINVVDKNGNFSKTTLKELTELNRTNIFTSNKIIIEILKNKKLLLHEEELYHKYPHCWRHKQPIIFRTTKQWFIKINKNKLNERILEIIKNIKWIPKNGMKRMQSMLIDRPDWCISRQRIWGIPLPLIIHKKSKKIHPNIVNIIEKIALKIEQHGIQAWWDIDISKLIGKDYKEYRKLKDIIDVWFDSGASYMSMTLNSKQFINKKPDICLEGFDQYRGWFMSSLIISAIIKNEAPCKQIISHGFVVDEHKHKMSKSVGNIIKPQEIVDKFGADILRLWTSSVDFSKEMSMSDNIIQLSVNNYRKIRNTIRFILANLNDFIPEKDMLNYEDMLSMDRWAVSQTKHVQDKIIKLYSEYKFHYVTQHILKFCSTEMSSFYLNVIKDRQYTTKNDSNARRSCQTALFHILEAMVRWIAPILSFTADEIWNLIPGKRKKYVFISEWYDRLLKLRKNENMNHSFWKNMQILRSELNAAIKSKNKNKTNTLDIDLEIYTCNTLHKQLLSLEDELHFIMITSKAKLYDYSQAPDFAWKSKKIKKLKLVLNKATGYKCSRCWHYTDTLSEINKYKKLCTRCVNNIIGSGENRKFV